MIRDFGLTNIVLFVVFGWFATVTDFRCSLGGFFPCVTRVVVGCSLSHEKENVHLSFNGKRTGDGGMVFVSVSEREVKRRTAF